MNRDYSDIIDLPHHVSTRHAHLPMESRAAQFSPFAALTGYGEAIEETARLTDTRSELDDSQKAELDETLRLLLPFLPRDVRVTHFVPDQRKEGGAYRTETLAVKKIDTVQRVLVLSDGGRIPIEDIRGIAFAETVASEPDDES